MTPAELKSARHALGLSAEGFARMVRVSNGRTVRKWEAGENDIPGPVTVILELADEVPEARKWLTRKDHALAVSRSKIAVILPLMLFCFTSIANSANSATTSKMAEYLLPLSAHQRIDLNHEVKSWITSPVTPTATASIATYAEYSQYSSEFARALYSSADATERRARRKGIIALIIAGLGIVYTFCLFYRWIWKKD